MKEAIEALTALRDRVQGTLDRLEGRTDIEAMMPEPIPVSHGILRGQLQYEDHGLKKKRRQTTAGTEARLAGLRKYHRKRRAEKARLERLRNY